MSSQMVINLPDVQAGDTFTRCGPITGEETVLMVDDVRHMCGGEIEVRINYVKYRGGTSMQWFPVSQMMARGWEWKRGQI